MTEPIHPSIVEDVSIPPTGRALTKTYVPPRQNGERMACEQLGRALIDAYSRGIKPGEGMALIQEAEPRIAYQRWVQTIQRLAGQIDRMARVAERGWVEHQETHERELRRLGELLQQAIDGRRRDGSA